LNINIKQIGYQDFTFAFQNIERIHYPFLSNLFYCAAKLQKLMNWKQKQGVK